MKSSGLQRSLCSVCSLCCRFRLANSAPTFSMAASTLESSLSIGSSSVDGSTVSVHNFFSSAIVRVGQLVISSGPYFFSIRFESRCARVSRYRRASSNCCVSSVRMLKQASCLRLVLANCSASSTYDASRHTLIATSTSNRLHFWSFFRNSFSCAVRSRRVKQFSKSVVWSAVASPCSCIVCR
uniref:Putative secreted protein n=1 Tax=Anopheles marajoara TaxID=58244 RepID=A0A2M4C5V2_9DIPT